MTALVHGEQISCQLVCYGESGPVAMSVLQLSGMKSRQWWIPARSELGSFDQGGL